MYAIAKIAGLKMCQAYRKQYGFDAIVAMPTNLYGLNDNFDLKQFACTAGADTQILGWPSTAGSDASNSGELVRRAGNSCMWMTWRMRAAS